MPRRRREVLVVRERPQHASHLGIVKDKLQRDRQRERRPREGVKDGEAAAHAELARRPEMGGTSQCASQPRWSAPASERTMVPLQPEDEDGDEGHEERGDQDSAVKPSPFSESSC